MNDNSKNKSGGLFSIGNVITAVLFVAVIIGYFGSKQGWFRFTNIQGDSGKEVSSISELKDNLEYEVSFPNFITDALNNGSSLVGKVKQSNFSEFRVDNTLIGTCGFVGYGVDPLDLKGTMYTQDENGNDKILSNVEIDKFSVENNSINHIEFLYNLPTFENCTLIVWNDNVANYSMLFGDKVEQSTILENWGIDSKDVSEYVENIDSNTNSEEETVSELGFDKITSTHTSISLPSGFKVMESDGYDIYSLDEKMLLAIMYTEDSISSDSFKGSGEINITDTVVLRYSKENPFKVGTESYETYEEVLQSIGKIAGSVEIK